MPRGKKKETVAAEPTPVEAVETTNTGAPEVKEAVTTGGLKASFDVFTAGGGFVRTYSVEDHGEDAEELAKQYAAKIGGSVK